MRRKVLSAAVAALLPFALAVWGPQAAAEPAPAPVPTVTAKPAAGPSTEPAPAAAPTAAPASKPAADGAAAAPTPPPAAPENSAERPKGEGEGLQAATPPEEPKKEPPPVTLRATIDLTRQRMTVSENGTVKYTWPISSGRKGYETPPGNFRPGWMARTWFSKQYDDAPMPHSVFFNGGIAVHGTTHTSALGRPASHGCVRLAPANAATFYKLVQKHSLAGTRIAVTGAAKVDEAVVARRREPNYYEPRYAAGARRPPPGTYYYYSSPPYGYGYQPRYYPPRAYSYNDPYGYTPYRGPAPAPRPYGYGYWPF